MIILGIDPSLAGMGWGVIDTKPLKYLDSGVIKTKSSEAMHKRLAFISSSLQKIIVQYKPAIVAMEETFVNINNVSSLKLGYARGAVMSLIGGYDIAFQEFKPNVIKKSVVGYGHAEKNQVLQMIKLLLPGAIAISNFDEADALAVAYVCWAYTSKTPIIEL
ncbi:MULTISPECIES: crossover junction endodeoxyribonuclease RuvC [unclassified Candidatus Tisiphia]|uniref:crossover junction endodeoxyribonuclease RuvC n=1 Tax=unclassified Candidatus Tisiphia TaxID=2996318 RepID=UPI001E7EC269|nr:MAG: crossover junction endodeoxyribonuclease RuvC [Rickettsia endosymbiont of Cimex lectularius]